MPRKSSRAAPKGPGPAQADMAYPEEQGSLRVVTEGEGDQDFEILSSALREQERQGQMFSSDELFLPEAIGTYRKPVAAIHAIPERRDTALRLSARKLMEALPLAVQLDLRGRGREASQEMVRKIREDRATPLFEIRTKELGRLAGLSLTNMERIHETLAEMVGFRFLWNVLGEDGQVEYEVTAPFLIRRDRGVGSKLGYSRFAFEPEVLLWFLEPKMWANLSWTVMSGIGHDSGPGQEAAFGLYQNIWRYIGTSAKVTPALDVATWIDLIVGPSRFVAVDAKGTKTVVDYKDFKRRFLVPGLAILNGLHALNHTVELREEKSGLKVVRLRFKFLPKMQGVFEFPLGWPDATQTALEDLGFSPEDLGTLSQLYPYTQVAEALKRLPEAEQRIKQAGSRVYSRKAFFKGILGNIAKGEALDAAAEARLAKEAERRERQEQDESRAQVLQNRFATHQANLVVEGFNRLSDAERTALLQEHWAARPHHRLLFVEGPLRGGYLAVFRQWVIESKPELVARWLPDSKDMDFQVWMMWQLTKPESEDWTRS